MSMQPELVLNLWAIYDMDIGMVYGLAGRAYCMTGTEEEKLDVLRRLSATDHVTAKRFRVPDRFTFHESDGTTHKRVAAVSAVHEPAVRLFEELLQNLAAELPPVMEFRGGDPVPRKQALPEEPLCVATVLYEDEVGTVRAIVSDEDRIWALDQEKRRGRAGAF